MKVNCILILVNPNDAVFFKELNLGFSDQMKNKLWLIIYSLGINRLHNRKRVNGNRDGHGVRNRIRLKLDE